MAIIPRNLMELLKYTPLLFVDISTRGYSSFVFCSMKENILLDSRQYVTVLISNTVNISSVIPQQKSKILWRQRMENNKHNAKVDIRGIIIWFGKYRNGIYHFSCEDDLCEPRDPSTEAPKTPEGYGSEPSQPFHQSKSVLASKVMSNLKLLV